MIEFVQQLEVREKEVYEHFFLLAEWYCFYMVAMKGF
jgi:hypothetical protein